MRKLSTLLLVIGSGTVVLASGCNGDDDDTAGGRSGGSAKGGSSGKGGAAGHAGLSGRGGSSGTGGSAARGGSSGKGTGGRPSQAGAGGSSSGAAGAGAVAGANEAGGGGSAGAPELGGNGGVDAGAGGEGGSNDAACASIDPEATVTSHLIVTADNEADVYVNGTSVGTTSSWSAAVTIDVSLYLYPGRENVVAIVGTNTSSQSGNDRGIVGQLTLETSSGTLPILVTDATWRVSTTEISGWSDPNFDDASWDFATELGAVGVSPWGNIIPDSTAKWIWSAPVPESTSDKPNLESTYARRSFYLGLDGITTSPTPSCP